MSPILDLWCRVCWTVPKLRLDIRVIVKFVRLYKSNIRMLIDSASKQNFLLRDL